MRVLVTAIGLCLLVGTAVAQGPAQKIDQNPVEIPRVECGFENVWVTANFGSENGGFAPELCDPSGLPAWDWGTDATITPPPAPFGPNVWGTVIGASYPSNTGDGLVSPLFTVVTGMNELVEIVHYLDIETNYDGCNIVVLDGAGETILYPMAGYPATINTSTSYYAYCVDMEPGFTGHGTAWTTACCDLTPWDGQEIALRFDFGSDSSVTYPGWFIAGITWGTDQFTPVEESSWSMIKALYR